ncbi:unnamed protein product [Darwinula stevensoni]|uniref:Fibronectin type-III domain-containing protein n=1 Tax=Darwinula stevensoni TaxID=69355 RepID=A0A7R8ZZF3_9CRUS|nr:unnamed protein product [Darwinula stevensoni]CAG0882415.1 unnamed protein product [Darwinula stevensoni]
MSCKYYSDIHLQKIPTSIEEALECYRVFPTLSREKCVPKRIYLFPLQKLLRRDVQMVRDISMRIVNEVEKLLEGLYGRNIKAKDLAVSGLCEQFPGLKAQLRDFQSLLDDFTLVFQEQVKPLMISVRAFEMEDQVLFRLLEEKRASPFGLQKLSDWLENKEREMNYLTKNLKNLQLPDVEMALSPDELDSFLLDLKAENVLCFRFKVMPRTDAYLSLMSRYLKEKDTETSRDESPSSWYENRQELQEGLEYFRGMHEAQRERGFRFVVTQEVPATASESLYEIVYYNKRVAMPYPPPLIPGTPRAVAVTENSIEVKWDPPACAANSVKGYLVSYKSDIDEEWNTHVVDGNIAGATLGGLLPNTEYFFKRVSGRMQYHGIYGDANSNTEAFSFCATGAEQLDIGIYRREQVERCNQDGYAHSMVAWVTEQTRWNGIGVINLDSHIYSIRATNRRIKNTRDGEEVDLTGGIWGGMRNRVFFFRDRKTFVVEVGRDPSWIPPSDQIIQSLPSLSPFHVSYSTCLIPCPVPENRFYFFGAHSKVKSGAGVFIPSEGEGTWLLLPGLPSHIEMVAGTSLHNGCIFIVGGLDYRKMNKSKLAFLYDPREGRKYVRLPDVPEPIVGAAAMEMKETGIILAGGLTDTAEGSEVSSQVRIFELRARKWEIFPSLRSPRAFLGLGKDPNDQLIAIGGYMDHRNPETMEVMGKSEEDTLEWKEYPLPHPFKRCGRPSVLL